MKKRLFILAMMVVLVATLLAVFTVTVSAEENAITVRYCHFSGSQRELIKPNADGTYTLRTDKFSGNGTVTLSDGSTIERTFYGWFDKEGVIYEPGATVKFTKDTDLFEAYGIGVTSAADLESATQAAYKTALFIRLMADIETAEDLNSSWGTMILDLNGHNLLITKNNQAISNYRGACMVVGQGKITHAPETINTKDDQTGFAVYQYHSYGDGDTMQHFIIGKDVVVETPYNLVRITNGVDGDGMPKMYISGTVKAKNLIRAGIISNATIKIFPSANLTFTGEDVFVFTNETGTAKYADLTIDGNIKLESGTAVMFDDFIMSSRFEITPITSGSYSFSKQNYEKISMLMSDTLMFYEETDENGTTWYKIKESDCTHVWQRVDSESIDATLKEAGIDVLECTECGTKKQKIALYVPNNAHVIVTVIENGERKQYTVLSSEVYEFGFVGNGINAKCTIVGIKDTTSFTKEQVVGIELPEGVASLAGFENATVEEIKFKDSSIKIEIGNLTLISALKSIKIGACDISFIDSKTTTLEGIYSDVPGATVTFGASTFANVKSLTTLKMSTGSTYKFNTNCFMGTNLTEVVFPDDSVVKFDGDAAFYGCINIKFVYFGLNCISDKKIYRKPFDCACGIETVVLMDIVYIDQYVFCCNGDANSGKEYCEGKTGYTEPLRVYHHGDTLEINGNAFANRYVYGVELYTMSELGTMTNCKHAIIQGLGHRYYEGAITESTCIEKGTYGYATDCPCGIDYRENSYTVIDDEGTRTYSAYGTDFVYLPLSDIHVRGTEYVDVKYDNYFENGYKHYLCAICANATVAEDEPSISPLFIALGYSVAEGDSGEMSHTISVDQKVLSYISEFKTVTYGTVAGVYIDGKPIDETGKVAFNNVKVEFKDAYYKITVKIGNISDALKDYGFNMVMYVIENDDASNVRYAYGNQTASETEKVSYNSLKEELEKVPEPPIEEEPPTEEEIPQE